MSRINFKQFLILIVIFFFLFGDFFRLKKRIDYMKKYLNEFITKKNRRKGN